MLPDRRIVSGSEDNIIIWKDYKVEFTLTGHNSKIRVLNVLSDNRLISGTENGEIRIWNTDTGECEIIFPKIYTGLVISIEVSSNGKIISGGGVMDSKIIVWK